MNIDIARKITALVERIEEMESLERIIKKADLKINVIGTYCRVEVNLNKFVDVEIIKARVLEKISGDIEYFKNALKELTD